MSWELASHCNKKGSVSLDKQQWFMATPAKGFGADTGCLNRVFNSALFTCATGVAINSDPHAPCYVATSAADYYTRLSEATSAADDYA